VEFKMSKVNVAVVVGSNRSESINRRLALALVELAGPGIAATFVRIDDLPMYNQDLESSLPASVQRFKEEIAEADAVLIVTPEHNRSIPAVLKNAIDWGARPYGSNFWSGKPAATIGASPGAIGTAVAQQHLRQVLGNLGVLVMGGEAYLTFKPGLIDDSGVITDAGTRRFLQGFVDQFVALALRFATGGRATRAA
jgi:chromate reductase